jgi:DNA polymerase III epsilon subunit-like protein
MTTLGPSVPPLPAWIIRRGISVLDLETTGREFRQVKLDGGDRTSRELDIARMEPVQAAIVEVDNLDQSAGPGYHYSVWTEYIRPVAADGSTLSIPKGATDIHGITNEHVRDAPTLAEVWPEMKKRLQGRVLVTYNGLRFDVPGLLAALARAGVTGPMPDPERQIDLLVWIRECDRWVKGPRRHTLEVTADRHGVLVSKYQAHRADADALMTMELFMALAGEHVGALRNDGATFYREQAVRAAAQEADFAAWKAKNRG